MQEPSSEPRLKLRRRLKYYETSAVHFTCLACGDCCHAWEGRVHLMPGDVPRLARFLGTTTRSFRHRYVRKDEDGEPVLLLRADGSCVFYSPAGLCSVHEAKPLLCRNFPVWEDVIRSKRNYEWYQTLCRGLGKGETIPMEEIRKRLEENGPGGR